MYKKIANIVFYKVSQGNKFVKQATIFFMDGTIRTVTFDEGIDACEQIVRERNIQTKDAFQAMINHDIVHVVSAKEFDDHFEDYIPQVKSIEESGAVYTRKMPVSPAHSSKKGEDMSSSSPRVNPVVSQSVDSMRREKTSIPTDIPVTGEEDEDDFSRGDSTEIPSPVVSTPISTGTQENHKNNDGLYHFDDEDEDVQTDSRGASTPSTGEDGLYHFDDEENIDVQADSRGASTPAPSDDGLYHFDDTEDVDAASMGVVTPSTTSDGEDTHKEDSASDDSIFIDSSDGAVDSSDQTSESTDQDDMVDLYEFVDGSQPVTSQARGNASSTGESTSVESDGKEFFEQDAGDDFTPLADESTPLSDSASASSSDDDEIQESDGFFKRLWKKIKKNSLVKRIVLCVTAFAVAIGLVSCSHRKSLEGEMYQSNLTSASDTLLDGDEELIFGEYDNPNIVHSSVLEDKQVAELLKNTKNEFQKGAMTHLGEAMDGFNNVFSAYYMEEGKDVRATLKFEEAAALQVAYNDYSKDQLKAYFNGSDIRAEDFTRSYKDASLQLMGAYAMENQEHPVDMSMLIDSQEGKDFYQKYHKAFLAAKSAEGEEQIRLVNEFYAMVRDDFPITEKVRTEGISHAENYGELAAYKLSVAPMIAAGETLWQNLDVDHTLVDGEIDFLNDLGLCNYADKSFERAELIALTTPQDEDNPKYSQYQEAFEAYYRDHNIYYVDDEHRELTLLDSFQDAVNGHFNIVDGEDVSSYEGETSTSTETHTKTSTHTKTTTTTHEETTTKNIPITDEAKEQVDREIDEENARAKAEAERQAEEERRRLQEEADRQAEQVHEEVRQDDQDLQDKIDEANQQIDQNQSDHNPGNDTPVNEGDLGHGVDFDDDHSDQNGNLDPSVGGITTDPSGDQSDEPLPDPNLTGADFDARGDSYYSAPVSYSSAVDEYVESLAGDSYYESGYAYQYTK